jgi:hypothetical protein
MGSVNHPKLYDAATMAMVREVFHEVWGALEGQDVFAVEAHGGLKAAIIRRLLDLVAEGTTSPQQLKAQVLKGLPLGGA